MSILKSKKAILAGIVVGIIVVCVANDELWLIQAQNQKQKDLARFYIGIISVISSVVVLLTTIGISEAKSGWIRFIRVTGATVTIVNVTFLSIAPQILIWLNM